MESAAESPAARLLGLLSLLQSRPDWTARELAERLEVTERTVRRDVTRLRDLGYPVEAEPGPHGGYRLGAGAALPPLLLTDDEAIAVVVGLRVATGSGITDFEAAAVAALAKLEQVMPSRLRQRVGAIHGATVPVRGREGPRVDADTLVTVAQACRGLDRLRFGYVDSEGQATERLVEPYQVVHVFRRWYLVARDPSRDAWRSFRLDRMQDVVNTGSRFVRREEIDAAKFVAEGMAIGGYPYQALIHLPVTVDEAEEDIAPTDGVLEPCEGGSLLRIGASTLDWIARYLVALPFGFQVIEPPALRKELRDLGTRLRRDHR